MNFEVETSVLKQFEPILGAIIQILLSVVFHAFQKACPLQYKRLQPGRTKLYIKSSVQHYLTFSTKQTTANLYRALSARRSECFPNRRSHCFPNKKAAQSF